MPCRSKFSKVESDAVGVGRLSDAEQSLSSVWGSNITSSNNCPSCVIPNFGKVLENFFESECEMASDVLQDDS